MTRNSKEWLKRNWIKCLSLAVSIVALIRTFL